MSGRARPGERRAASSWRRQREDIDGNSCRSGAAVDHLAQSRVSGTVTASRLGLPTPPPPSTPIVKAAAHVYGTDGGGGGKQVAKKG